MKKSTITSALLGVSLVLPATMLAQTTPTPPTSPTSNMSQDKDRYGDKKHGDYSKHDKSASTSSIRAVPDDELENRLTAENVIGKDVVDVRGDKIGSVKDISLGSALDGVVGKEARATDRRSDSTLATTPGASTTNTGTMAGSTMGRTSTSSSSSDFDRTRNSFGSAIAGMNDQVEVFVSVGGVMGVGSSLVSIPFSQLEWNAEEEHFRLDISQDEIRAITDNARQVSTLD
ncbi:hypothetical protein ASA1KI_03390 [Opitutales bacterium ASA1]|uniref:PRC-barrel domain-containing protein n=1 Tax=Congregicoccus parvus TaxID=3081749 RepID=UPI002B2C6D16|nr:hypothetical protein ASA1KI_03390 [Opitutales bacterium ASA1]